MTLSTDLAAPVITLVSFLKIELPGRDVRLCDGGFIYFDGEKYDAIDDDLGTAVASAGFASGAGDQMPSGMIAFLPASTAAAADLSAPAMQFSRVRLWCGPVGADGKTVAAAQLLFDGLIDTTELVAERGTRTLEIGVISRGQRLLSRNRGNTCTPRFHQSIWPGEKGFDNAGFTGQVAWGAEAATASGAGTGSGGAIRDGYGQNRVAL